jgi:hypothetical protein
MLNVLFASSEYSYPFRLKEDVGFNLADIGKVVVAGEVPPNKMGKLLRDKWKLGPRLINHCLAWYGGHIYSTVEAISSLSLRKEDFSADMAGPSGMYAGIVECVAAEAKHPGMIDLLRNISVFGFASIGTPSDPRTQLLVKSNVAGYVDIVSFAVGLPLAVWDSGVNFGLVPASQQVRIMIGKVLSSRGLALPTKGITYSAPWLLDTFPL